MDNQGVLLVTLVSIFITIGTILVFMSRISPEIPPREGIVVVYVDNDC